MVTQTVHRYLALLETIFLISLLPARHTAVDLRFIKSAKLTLIDTGLLTYLLGVNEISLPNSLYVGKVLENFIVSELKKQITWSITKPDMYHFRTAGGEEVDIVLENRTQEIVALEIKTVNESHRKILKGSNIFKQK